MAFAVIFGVGILIGLTIALFIFHMFIGGTLRIDHSDPLDSPYMFLELSKKFDWLCRKNYIVLKVRIKNYVSHK